MVVKLEFVVNRLDDPKPPSPPSGKAFTAARLVIPLPGVIDLFGKLQMFVGQLQAQGVLRPIQDPGGSQRPN